MKYNYKDSSKDLGLLFSAFSNMPGGFLVYSADESKTIKYFNKEILNMFDCSSDEEFLSLCGGTFDGVVVPEDISFIEDIIREHEDDNDVSFDRIYFRIRTAKGNIRYVESFLKTADIPGLGKVYYVFLALEQRMYDSLTGLTDKEYLLSRDEKSIRDIISEGKKIDCIAIEISGLKDIDLYYGQQRKDLLRYITKLLVDIFGRDRVFRFGKDNFYAYTVDSPALDNQLNSLIIDFNQRLPDTSLVLLIGVYDGLDEKMTLETAFERAHLACTLHHDSYRSGIFHLGDKDIKDDITKDYVLRNIDRAIEEGWIVPYFQPIIRTLSGRACAGEALARWIDPIYGIISPGVFIPVLEEAELSYKLDMCIVRACAELLKKRIDRGETVWPVSVNLSASDFTACDPVSLIVSIVDDYSLPRDLVCVEITETAITRDKQKTMDYIRRFHENGIHVYMDDFGSGYSSLNLLKDFDFDLIKIDMLFLRNFDERARTIITMAVSMAKKLGLHTLAEGVETAEQVAFLKEIGCERMQGYFFGKPLPENESLLNIAEKGIEVEDRESAAFYEKVGRVDLVNDFLATALFFDDGKAFKAVYMNENYRYVLSRTGLDPDDVVEINMNAASSPNGKKFRNLANRAFESHMPERMTFVVRGHYYHYSFRFIASSKSGNMLLAHIDDKEYGENKNLDTLDSVIRNIVSAYDSMYLVDITKDIRTVVLTDRSDEYAGQVVYNLRATLIGFAERNIHIDDRERFLNFGYRENLARKFGLSGRGSFSDVFRVIRRDGNYEWKEFMVIAVPETNGQQVIICIRIASIEDQEDKTLAALRIADLSKYMQSITPNIYSDLWRSLMQVTDIKFFWKDRERRFMGASASFLDYYDYKNQDFIVGKTDEELGMNVDDEVFRKNERIVLDQGKIVTTRGLNIVDGKIRPIHATKMPFYKGNEIAGLIGYFIDVNEDYAEGQKILNDALVDPSSGLATARGLLVAYTDLDDNYYENSEDYTVVILRIDGVEAARTEYGTEVVQELRSLVIERIRSVYGQLATIGKIPGMLAICFKRLEDRELSAMNANCIKAIESIRHIDEHRFTLHIELGCAHRSEVNTVEELFEETRKRLMHTNNRIGEESFTPDPYFDISVPYIIIRPVFDDGGKVIDGQYVYVNKKYCDFAGKTAADLLDRSYHSSFKNTSIKWGSYIEKALRGEYVHERVYSIEIGLWVEFLVTRCSLPGCVSMLFIKVE